MFRKKVETFSIDVMTRPVLNEFLVQKQHQFQLNNLLKYFRTNILGGNRPEILKKSDLDESSQIFQFGCFLTRPIQRRMHMWEHLKGPIVLPPCAIHG